MTEPIHILSLGAGVQSSTLALMAAKGEIGPMPTAAIFADTGAEPKPVMAWLDWLEPQLPFPVYRVMQGEGLWSDVMQGAITKKRASNPPFMTANGGRLGRGGKSEGLARSSRGFGRPAGVLRRVKPDEGIILIGHPGTGPGIGVLWAPIVSGTASAPSPTAPAPAAQTVIVILRTHLGGFLSLDGGRARLTVATTPTPTAASPTVAAILASVITIGGPLFPGDGLLGAVLVVLVVLVIDLQGDVVVFFLLLLLKDIEVFIGGDIGLQRLSGGEDIGRPRLI